MGHVVSVFLRSPFNYDRDAVSDETGQANNEPSLTQQSFADECDINTIVERFGLTGQLPEPLSPQYGDFSAVGDFQSAMNAIADAQSGFMSLPGHLRARFANDPGNLISFLEDPANLDEAVRLGLVNSSSDKQEPPEAVVAAPAAYRVPEVFSRYCPPRLTP